jgi:hypothetical protein
MPILCLETRVVDMNEKKYFDGPPRLITGEEIIKEYNQFETIYHKQRLGRQLYLRLDEDFKQKFIDFVHDASAEGVHDPDIFKIMESLE